MFVFVENLLLRGAIVAASVTQSLAATSRAALSAANWRCLLIVPKQTRLPLCEGLNRETMSAFLREMPTLEVVPALLAHLKRLQAFQRSIAPNFVPYRVENRNSAD